MQKNKSKKCKKQMFSILLKYINYLIFIIRFYSHLLWIKLNKYISTNNYIKSNKIIIIGDGFAEGFGDYITFGSKVGISKYIENEIEKDVLV